MGDRVSGLTISAIFDALKAQLGAGGGDRQYTVLTLPLPPDEDTPPDSITIEPEPDFIDYFQSMGGNGIALIRGALLLKVGGADYQSRFIRLYDYLSAGTGNAASLIDAVLSDRTLGGVVDDCVILRVDVDRNNVTARLPFEIRVRKVGAQA